MGHGSTRDGDEIGDGCDFGDSGSKGDISSIVDCSMGDSGGAEMASEFEMALALETLAWKMVAALDTAVWEIVAALEMAATLETLATALQEMAM